MGYTKIKEIKEEEKKKRTWRWTEKQLHRIPAMCCELWPATLVILILRPEEGTQPYVENVGWVALSGGAGCSVSQLGSLWLGYWFQLPPHFAVLRSSKVIGGITLTLTVIVRLCLHANVKPTPDTHTHTPTFSLPHTPTAIHTEWMLGKRQTSVKGVSTGTAGSESCMRLKTIHFHKSILSVSLICVNDFLISSRSLSCWGETGKVIKKNDLELLHWNIYIYSDVLRLHSVWMLKFIKSRDVLYKNLQIGFENAKCKWYILFVSHVTLSFNGPLLWNNKLQ